MLMRESKSVKKIIMLCFTLITVLVLIVGAFIFNKELNKDESKEANSFRLPKVEEFHDEYSRGFMYSTKEVEEGYYLFESADANADYVKDSK